MPGTKKLIDPQGQIREVPDEQVSASLSSGWRAPTPDDTAVASTAAANEQDFGGVGGALKAAGYAAARGATLGISDPLFEAAGVPARNLRGLEEEHPVVSAGAELAGTIAPSLLFPESIAARTPTGIVSGVGHDIIKHASREGAGILERAAISSTAAAAEGAFYGGGQYLSDLALGNQPLSVEGFVGSVGKGALFSAPIGGVFTLGEGALIRARSLFPRNEVSAAAAGGVKQEASSALTSAVADGDEMASKARQQIDLNEAQSGMAQSGQDITRRMFGDADPTLVTSQAAVGADTAKLREAYQAYQSSRAQLIDWMHNEGDLEASLAGLTPGSVQGRDFVPQGEFGPPGQGGFKSQDELARLAGDRGDAVAPTTPSSQEVTRVGKSARFDSVPDNKLSNPDTAPLADVKAQRDRINSEVNDFYKEHGYTAKLPDDLRSRAEYADYLDDLHRERFNEEWGYHKELLPYEDVVSLAKEVKDNWLRAAKDGSSEERVKLLENSYDNLQRIVDKRSQLNTGDPDRIIAVNRLGVGSRDGIELHADGDEVGKYKSADGSVWRVTMDGERNVSNPHVMTSGHQEMFNGLVSNRLARALDSKIPEVRIGYIDGVPHLLERQVAAVEDAATNPLINAWAKDVLVPRPSDDIASGIGDAMRDVLAGATQAEAERYVDGLSDAISKNREKLNRIIDASGLGTAAKAQAKARVESQIAWLLAHRDEIVKSVAGAAGGISASSAPSPSSAATSGGDLGSDRSTHSTRVGRVVDVPSPDLRGSSFTTPESVSRGDDLEALLRGTKSQLDQGVPLKDISDASPARADYVADKLRNRALQADEFRSRALDDQATAVGTHADLAERAKSLANSPPDFEPPFVEVPKTKVDPAIKMRMRIAERDHGIEAALGKTTIDRDIHNRIRAAVEEEFAAGKTSVDHSLQDRVKLAVEEENALGKTIVDHGMKARVQHMTDDEAIAKLLGQRVGKDVNMGASLNRAAKAIGDFEAASADLVDMLGADAPAGAAERARAYRGATANQADAVGASTARAAEGLQGIHTTVDDEIDRALRKHDAAQARKTAQAAQTNRLAQKSSEAPPAPAAGAVVADKASTSLLGGALGKATKAGVALEVLKALGVHVPALSAIPVIGPLLGLFLKAKAVMGIIGRKGGSIDSTIEGVIARRSAQVQDRVTAATSKLLEVGAKVAGKASEASAGPATVLAHKLFPGGKDSKSKDPVELYHARMDELSRALAPGAVDQAIGDRIQTADPRLKDAVAAQYLRAMQFLYSKAPHEVVLPGMLPGDGKWQPSKAQLNEWAKYVHYVGDPASVLEDLANGVVTLEGAETLRTVYPELYSLAQQTLIKAAPEMQRTLPYTKRVAMSIMFGVPIDSTLTASHMSFLQHGSASGGGGGAGPAPAAAPPPGAPGLTGPINIGQQTLTALDRRAGG